MGEEMNCCVDIQEGWDYCPVCGDEVVREVEKEYPGKWEGFSGDEAGRWFQRHEDEYDIEYNPNRRLDRTMRNYMRKWMEGFAGSTKRMMGLGEGEQPTRFGGLVYRVDE